MNKSTKKIFKGTYRPIEDDEHFGSAEDYDGETAAETARSPYDNRVTKSPVYMDAINSGGRSNGGRHNSNSAQNGNNVGILFGNGNNGGIVTRKPYPITEVRVSDKDLSTAISPATTAAADFYYYCFTITMVIMFLKRLLLIT